MGVLALAGTLDMVGMTGNEVLSWQKRMRRKARPFVKSARAQQQQQPSFQDYLDRRYSQRDQHPSRQQFKEEGTKVESLGDAKVSRQYNPYTTSCRLKVHLGAKDKARQGD